MDAPDKVKSGTTVNCNVSKYPSKQCAGTSEKPPGSRMSSAARHSSPVYGSRRISHTQPSPTCTTIVGGCTPHLGSHRFAEANDLGLSARGRQLPTWTAAVPEALETFTGLIATILQDPARPSPTHHLLATIVSISEALNSRSFSSATVSSAKSWLSLSARLLCTHT